MKNEEARTRVFVAPDSSRHLAPTGYPERPERLAGIVAELERQGRDLVQVPPLAAGEEKACLEAIEKVHDPAYVDRFRRATDRGDGLLDSADNPLSAGTWDAALGAVHTSLEAAAWTLAGEGRRAFVAARPPGHHAERATAMGFCFFNQIAVTAQALLEVAGIERVAIFDFDVHHGNGTQHLFEERAEIYFASTHQFPFYPGTGSGEEIGRGAGVGTTCNVPLPAGTGDEGYAEAFDAEILPWLRRAQPEALLISAGFDAWQGDPLGGMRVSRDGFRSWGRRLAELADELTAGRLLSVLEGGYDLEALPSLVGEYLDGLEEPRTW